MLLTAPGTPGALRAAGNGSHTCYSALPLSRGRPGLQRRAPGRRLDGTPRAAGQAQGRLRCRSTAQPSVASAIIGTSTGDFRWGSFMSDKENVEDAVAEAVNRILQSIGADAKPNIALIFVSSAYGEQYDRVLPALRELLPSLTCIFGSSGYGVVGVSDAGAMEAEGTPGISISLGCLAGVQARALHTLRSAIPDEDASPDRWAAFTGVPACDSAKTSFLLVADPRFQQVRQLLAGLDYAYPAATKIGGLISSGSKSKSRAMFAWNAQQQQQQQQASGGSTTSSSTTGSSSSSAAGAAAAGGGEAKPQGQSFLGAIGSWFGSKLTGSDGSSSDSSSGSGEGSSGGGSSSSSSSKSWLGQLLEDLDDDQSDDDSDESPSGVYMYGAVLLVLRGDVTIDPIISQGYRTVGERVWRVESTLGPNTIVTVTDPSESGSDELPAITPVLAMLEDLGSAASDKEISELVSGLAVAVAADPLKPASELSPDDFQLVGIEGLDESYGVMSLAGEIKTGCRLRMVVRDEAGVQADLQAKLLAYKRRDLQAMLTGKAAAPAFGVLLFTDMERGTAMYGDSHVESRQVMSYVPAPLAGMFASGQVGSSGGRASLYEFTCVAGILRAGNNSGSDGSETGSSSSSSSSSSGGGGSRGSASRAADDGGSSSGSNNSGSSQDPSSP